MELREKVNQVSHSAKNLIIILLLLVLFGLGAIIVFKKSGISMDNYNAIVDSLHTSRDAQGRQTASIKALQFEREKDFVKLQTNDSIIKWLQVVVKDFKGQVNSAVVAALSTHDFGSSGTTILAGDAVLVRDTVRLYPRYSTKWSEKWSSGDILATKDSIFRNIKVKNEWEMVIGKPNRSWKNLFVSPKLDVTLKNLNPNTETTELRSFTVSNPQKRFGIGLSTGVQLNSDLKVRPYIGVGLNFNIIEFNLRGRQK